MKKCTDKVNFQRWPFIAEAQRADGERNNGGIDLIAKPEQIDAIHEATDENGLKLLIQQLNGSNSPFMTLGCASGQDGEHYLSYLEFTFRDPDLARLQQVNISIEDKWVVWLSERLKNHPEWFMAIKNNVAWEYREFSLRNAPAQYLVTVYPRARNAADHGQLTTWIYDFFKSILTGEIKLVEKAEI